MFDDVNLGVRLFGNLDSNRWQYNLAFFDMLDKDTNSGLNKFESRQEVVIANLYGRTGRSSGSTPRRRSTTTTTPAVSSSTTTASS